MRPALIALLFSSAMLALGCAQKSLAPTSFAPSYRTMLDPSDVTIARSCAAASSVVVKNALPGNVVGQRTLESGAVPPQPISLTGNPVAWVRAGAAEMFRQGDIRVNANAPTVSLSLSQLRINESVHVNADYDARVVIDAALLDTQGRECWNARKTGTAQNIGHHGTAEAYRETIDHALDRALMSVVADESFQNALCRKCAK